MDLSKHIEKTLAEKATFAAVIYSLLFCIYISAVELYTTAPSITAFFGTYFLGLGVLRFRLAKLILNNSQKSYLKIFSISVALNSLGWGVFCFLNIKMFGNDHATVLLLLPTAGILGGSILSLAPAKKLIWFHISVIVGPIIVAFLMTKGAHHLSYAILSFSYLAYLILQGKKVSELSLKEISNALIVSEQKNHLQRSWLKEQMAMKAKTDFMNLMSHEMRTPLNGIMGMIEVLLDGEVDEKNRPNYFVIRDSAQRLLNLFEKFAGATEQPSDKIVLNSSPLIKPLNLSILLVDDGPENLLILKTLLTKRGHRVSLASNGAEALEEMYKEKFDLVFMDCQMPELDGFQATKLIRAREQWKSLPIIALTANALKGDREKCLEAGMDDFLSKPVEIKQIEKKIEYWMSRKLA